LKSIKITEKLGQKYEIGKGLYEYGIFLKNHGRSDEARKKLEAAYLIFKEIGSRDYLNKAGKALGIEEIEFYESPDSMQRLKRRETLSSIIKVSQTISSILQLEVLLEKIVSLAMETIGAQRGYLFIKNEESENLELKVRKSVLENTIVLWNISLNPLSAYP